MPGPPFARVGFLGVTTLSQINPKRYQPHAVRWANMNGATVAEALGALRGWRFILWRSREVSGDRAIMYRGMVPCCRHAAPECDSAATLAAYRAAGVALGRRKLR